MNERSLSNRSSCSSLKHADLPSFQNLPYPYSFDTSLRVSLLLLRTLCAECRPHTPTASSPFLPSCLTEPSSSKCKLSRFAAPGLCSPKTQPTETEGSVGLGAVLTRPSKTSAGDSSPPAEGTQHHIPAGLCSAVSLLAPDTLRGSL